MRPSHLLASVLAAGSLVVSAAACAQTRNPDYGYRFEDDALLGETLATLPPALRVPPKGRRVLLIRPRVSLVAELIGSIEDI